MEQGVYDKVAEYLTLMGRTELLTCLATQNSFGKIRDQAQQVCLKIKIMERSAILFTISFNFYIPYSEICIFLIFIMIYYYESFYFLLRGRNL